MPNANLFLLGIPAWTVFAGVAAIGFVTLVAAPLTGGLLEHDAAVSAADGPDHDGFGIFNSRVVGVFLAAFGGVGVVADYAELSPAGAAAAAVGGGFVCAWIVYRFGKFLYRQQASSEITDRNLILQSARVVVAIPPGGVGQVRCKVGEEIIDKIARTQDGTPLAENSIVYIEDIVGEVVTVRPQSLPGG
jgi:membrane protein implicated in regulation of membrane protease activity